MIAEELLRAGRLDDALKALQEQVRSQPSNATLRIFLFQLLAVMGQWARAQNQLKVVGELDASALPMVQTYSTAIDCEALRREVFAGRLTPVILGQPAEWIAPLLQALSLDAEGHGEAAQALREQAFDAAPAVPGRIGEAPFAWLADADTRLGPVLEVIVNGRYAWLPMSNLRSLKVEAPSDLRDLVRLPAELTLANGGATVALLPARYAETVEHGDDAARLGARPNGWTAACRSASGCSSPMPARLRCSTCVNWTSSRRTPDMAELTLQERLQPSLLDRLTDDEPGNLKEAAERRVLTLNQLKASVLRDLAWLFNTTSLFDHGPAARMPAGNSVLNYGLPALAGHTASSVDVHAIEALLTETIATFEPRIIRSSLRVRAQLLPGEMDHNALSFEIEGDLWAEPAPLRLLLTTNLDLETGHVRVAQGERRRT